MTMSHAGDLLRSIITLALSPSAARRHQSIQQRALSVWPWSNLVAGLETPTPSINF